MTASSYGLPLTSSLTEADGFIAVAFVLRRPTPLMYWRCLLCSCALTEVRDDGVELRTQRTGSRALLPRRSRCWLSMVLQPVRHPSKRRYTA